MQLLKTTDENFKDKFDELLKRGQMDMEHVSKIVSAIIAEIKKDGNSALQYNP